MCLAHGVAHLRFISRRQAPNKDQNRLGHFHHICHLRHLRITHTHATADNMELLCALFSVNLNNAFGTQGASR